MSIKDDYRRQLDGVFFKEDFEKRTAQKMREAAQSISKTKQQSKIIEVDFSSKMLLRTAAAVVAAVVLMTGTVFAADAIRTRLTASQVAKQVGIDELRIAFDSPEATVIDESIESNGWRITLLGITTGNELAEKFPSYDAEKSKLVDYEGLGLEGDYVAISFDNVIEDAVGTERMYVAAAVERLDGVPLSEDSDMPMLTAFIDGYTPNKVNSCALGFTSERFVQDGVAYYLFDFADFRAFADHTVRLAAHDGVIPSENIFTKAEDGSVSYASGYNGTQAMFTLPIEPDGKDHSEAEKLADLFESLDVKFAYEYAEDNKN